VRTIHIKGGRLIDPKNRVDAKQDVFISEGKIAALGRPPAGFRAEHTIDASSLIVCPGLIDLSARLREPGFEYKATLESEMQAAVAGGVTSLACPPDTDPPLDEPGLVEMLKFRAKSLNLAHVFPVGALTWKLGGERLTEGEFAKGTFVQPTVVEVPEDSWIWKTELFVPFVSVAPFDELDDAIEKANDTEYGLTAGLYSEDQAEIDEWLDRIQAGVIYVNRRAGATTGAWPGVQPFGGWKGSGTTGKAGGGPYYVTQYLREQSRTVIAE